LHVEQIFLEFRLTIFNYRDTLVAMEHEKFNEEQTMTLAEIVENRTVTMGDLADKAQIRAETLSGWCNGRKRPDPEPARRLAGVLGITLDELYAAYDAGVAERQRVLAAEAAEALDRR
jgi:transcriptional regulator with XRE-family HTH domain